MKDEATDKTKDGGRHIGDRCLTKQEMFGIVNGYHMLAGRIHALLSRREPRFAWLSAVLMEGMDELLVQYERFDVPEGCGMPSMASGTCTELVHISADELLSPLEEGA